MPWDPLNAWPSGRRWLWMALCGLTVIAQGPSFVRSLGPTANESINAVPGPDFFRNWAAARCLLDGFPVYAHQADIIERYLGFRPDPDPRNPSNEKFQPNPFYVAVFTHPPSSVWLTVPVAGWSYPTAMVIWNVVSLIALTGSLALMARELKIGLSASSVFPAVTLLLVCSPLRVQVLHGQLNLVLLALLVGTWVAERRGVPGWAGGLLGIATAVKLFPAFLFLYFLLRRDWKAVLWGGATFVAVIGVTWVALGGGAFRDYLQHVIPHLSGCRSNLTNASLSGLWSKLFDPGNAFDAEQFKRIYHSPLTARVATLLSCLAVTGVMGWVVHRAVSRSECDQAFGLAVTAMLLVSPVTWDHYFVLLALPLGLIWVALPSAPGMKACFALIVGAFWANPVDVWDAVFPHRIVATPLHTLTVLSFHLYALMGLFALGFALATPRRADPANLSHPDCSGVSRAK